MCSSLCTILLHAILYRTDVIIFPLALQTINIAPMMSIWGKGGGDPDHRLDTGFFLRIRHYWIGRHGKWLTDINLLLHPVIHSYWFARWRQWLFGYIFVPISNCFVRWRDWYRDTGKTCLGWGMRCLSASSWLKLLINTVFLYVYIWLGVMPLLYAYGDSFNKFESF